MTAVTEDEVAAALEVGDAVAEVRRVLRAWPDGLSAAPRTRLAHAGTGLNVLAGIVLDDTGQPWVGTKSYIAREKGAGHVVVLHPPDRPQPYVVEAELLGAIRTGAVSAVATAAMHPGATRLACVGAGRQAEYQIRAIAALGGLDSVAVTGRTAARSEELAGRLTAELELPVRAYASVEEALTGADVVCTMTRAADPVLWAGQLAPGTHVNAAGSNALDRQEIDVEILRRADVVVDSRDQAPLEAGDLLPLVESGELAWAGLLELGEVVSAATPFQRTREFTVFESLGMGVLDIALAALVVRVVRAAQEELS